MQEDGTDETSDEDFIAAPFNFLVWKLLKNALRYEGD